MTSSGLLETLEATPSSTSLVRPFKWAIFIFLNHGQQGKGVTTPPLPGDPGAIPSPLSSHVCQCLSFLLKIIGHSVYEEEI